MKTSKSFTNLSFRDGTILNDQSKQENILNNIIRKVKNNPLKQSYSHNNLIVVKTDDNRSYFPSFSNVKTKNKKSKKQEIAFNQVNNYVNIDDIKKEETTFIKMFLGNYINKDEKEMMRLNTLASNENNVIKKIHEDDLKDHEDNMNLVFCYYFNGLGYFTYIDKESIVSFPIPLVGNSLNRGDKIRVTFKKKNSCSEKQDKVNKIFAKQILI